MTYTADFFAAAIVAVGDFNPAIFSPDWLERHALIGADDADAARETQQLIVTHQVTKIETGWFVLQVLENQISITSKGVLTPALKDLAIGIFQLVPHTPIQAIGLNFMGDYKMPSEDEYHRIGDVLVPKGIWDDLYPDEDRMAGLANLTVRVQHGARGKQLLTGDEKRISFMPSGKVRMGVYLTYNDHHDLKGADDQGRRPGERAAALIDGDWDAAWQDAIRVFEAILSKALGAKAAS